MKPKKRKKAIYLVPILGLALGLTAAGCVKTERQTIKIVTSVPMRTITVGQGIVNGVKLALEEIDYKVGNFDIELVIADDGDETGAWQADLEKNVAEKAVADSDVMVYIGTYNSGAAKISIPITNQAGLVQISPGNTWPGLTQAGFMPGEPGIFYPTGTRNYFRVCPTDALQGPAGAVWAKELGYGSVFIVDDGEAYGKGITGLFEAKALELGLEIKAHTTISAETVDATLALITTDHPDLVYYGGTTPNGAIPLVRGLRTSLPEAAFMGPDGIMEQAFIDQGGEATENVFVTVVGIPPKSLTGSGASFYQNYLDTYKIEPETFSAFGYEAAKVAIQAIEKAGKKDRAAILEHTSNTQNYEGLFGGKWSFDSNGDTSLALISASTVKDGAFTFDQVLTIK